MECSYSERHERSQHLKGMMIPLAQRRMGMGVGGGASSPFRVRGQGLASLPFIVSDLDKRDENRMLTRPNRRMCPGHKDVPRAQRAPCNRRRRVGRSGRSDPHYGRCAVRGGEWADVKTMGKASGSLPACACTIYRYGYARTVLVVVGPSICLFALVHKRENITALYIASPSAFRRAHPVP